MNDAATLPDPAPAPKKKGLLRRYFLIGLAGILPLLLTVIIVLWGITLFDEYISRYIVRTPLYWALQTEPGVRLLAWLGVEERFRAGDAAFDEQAYREVFESQWIKFASVPVTLVLIWVIGVALAKFGGRRLLALMERAVGRFPGVRGLYATAKQLVDFFFSEQKVTFERVVLVEYPRRDMWAVGLVTGQGLRTLNARDTGAGRREHVSVFLPSSPTPMTGYVVFVPIVDVLLCDLTVDEAMTLIISGGVITPPREAVSYSDEHVARHGTRVVGLEHRPPAAGT